MTNFNQFRKRSPRGEPWLHVVVTDVLLASETLPAAPDSAPPTCIRLGLHVAG
jgi:hypothetical protein